MFGLRKKIEMPAPEDALEGRDERMPVPDRHTVLDAPLEGPFDDRYRMAMFGMGCFWGAERKFWQAPGVVSTAVGYAGGYTPNPTYREVCGGRTGHNEVVRVVYDPDETSYRELLRVFWENHDPTQGMKQGNDVGTQYRSGIYTFDDGQSRMARESLEAYQERLEDEGYAEITTEVQPAGEFYFAEEYHQQYLDKNPNGYCGLGGTGVTCPVGLFED